MAKLNTKEVAPRIFTGGGGLADAISSVQQLRRSVLACMLWEDIAYEGGQSVAQRIADLVRRVQPLEAYSVAVEAREDMKLRHVPLLIAREMARVDSHKFLVADLLERVIQRPDELAEFLAIYWKDKKDQPLSAQVKKGLARAFGKFDEYALAKYNQDGAVKLRDVLFLCHAKPQDAEQDRLWKRLIENQLEVPDTWETALSSGADKRATWARLLREKKLGALALIRNLRNMEEAGVQPELIRKALRSMDLKRVLPFRLLTAAKHAPQWEKELDAAVVRCAAGLPKLPGRTAIVVDLSGSMGNRLSAKSETTRRDAAIAMAVIAREICEDAVVYATAGDDYARRHATAFVPDRRGAALRDAVNSKQAEIGGGGIFLTQVMDFIEAKEVRNRVDRVIVITDEADCESDPARAASRAKALGATNYIVNVGSERNGIAYRKFTHVDGWSEAVLDFIVASEYGAQKTYAPQEKQAPEINFIGKVTGKKVKIGKDGRTPAQRRVAKAKRKPAKKAKRKARR